MPTSTTTTFDELRRRAQAQLFAGLPQHVERLTWSRPQVAEHQRSALRALLARALEESPLHARRLAGLDPSTFELEDLAGLPTMSKAEMMAGFDDLLTERRLGRRGVEEALAMTTVDPVPVLGEYLCMASGGSSGQRAVFVFDVAALVDYATSILRPAVARRGGPPPAGATSAMVGAASPIHATGLAPRLLEGSPLSFTSVPVTLPLGELVGRLDALQPMALFGYAGMLARLAHEQRAGRLRISPRSVTATSEVLLPQHRAAITEAFVPPVDMFATTEGLVGSSAPGDTTVTFASDCCIVELVDEHDRPVPPGVRAAKALVTNLFNHVQPLIRYELGDCFVRRPDVPEHGHLRATVEGRADEVLHFGELAIHPAVVRSVLVSTPAVVDYQACQTLRGLDLAVVADREVALGRLCELVSAALADAGLPSPEVRARAVERLPRQPDTGKLRRFIPC
ncbi:MAG: hypothetical protein GEV08_13835 [Acidimicrobiia bacterium]|nr:hypothetical protein [Acidimicrobiia bacterium]